MSLIPSNREHDHEKSGALCNIELIFTEATIMIHAAGGPAARQKPSHYLGYRFPRNQLDQSSPDMEDG